MPEEIDDSGWNGREHPPRRGRHAARTPPDGVPREAPRRPSVARSALITSASFAIVPLSALVTGPLLARVLGPYERGLMAAVLAPMFVAMFVAAFAIPEATTYVIARRGVPARRAAFVGAMIVFACGVVTATCLWLAAPLILSGTPEAIPYFHQVLPCLPLLMYTLVQRFAMSGAGKYGIVAVERTASAGGRLLLLVAFAVTGTLTANTAAWANVASTLLACLVLLIPLTRMPRGSNPADLDTRPAVARTMLGYGIRGWGGVCANLVNWRLDQALLPALVGATSLGFYAVAAGLAELPATLIGATKSVVFTEASARDNLRLAARATRVVLVVTAIVDVMLIAAAPWLIPLLFGSEFEESIPLAQVLLLGNVPFTAEVILAAGLLAAGQPGRRSVGQIVAAVVTLGGIFWLVPLIGVIGAALISLTAYLLSFVITLGYFCRVSGVGVSECVVPRRRDVTWARELVTGRLRSRRARKAARASGA